MSLACPWIVDMDGSALIEWLPGNSMPIAFYMLVGRTKSHIWPELSNPLCVVLACFFPSSALIDTDIYIYVLPIVCFCGLQFYFNSI